MTPAYPAPTAQTRHQTAQTAQSVALFDLLLTALVACLLAWLAWPLGPEWAAHGLGGRYANADDGSRQNAAVWLATNVRWLLPAMAASGWLALRAARSNLPWPSAALLVFGIWAVATGSTRSPDWGTAHLGFGALALILGFASANALRGRFSAAAGMPAPLVYPGFVLLSGLGLLLAIDYSARGRLALEYQGLSHFAFLQLAYLVFALAACCASPLAGLLTRAFAAMDPEQAVVGFSARSAASWLNLARRNILPIAFLAWAVAVALMSSRRFPATATELMRLPLYFLGGWVMLRWMSRGHARRAVVAAALVLAAITAGHMGLRDMGQVLILGLCMLVVMGVAIAHRLGASRLSIGVGLLFAVGAASAVLAGLSQHADLLAALLKSSAFLKRLDAVNAVPFEGEGLHFLSELRWLMASAPSAFGHGLGATPWCGTATVLEVASSCAAAPKELISDYVMAALFAVFGAPGALLTFTATVLWLAMGARVSAAPRLEATQLLQWAFACFAVIHIVQVTHSALGNLGLVVLTGVNFPLVGNGNASLLCSAFMAGLVATLPHRRLA